MIATWHVLRFRQDVDEMPWRPAGAAHWQAGPSAGDRVAMLTPACWAFLGTWPDEDTARAAETTAARLVGGAPPFADLPRTAALDGPVAVLTAALVSPDPVMRQTFFAASSGPVAGSLTAEPGCLAQSNQLADEIDGLAAFTFTVWDQLRSARAWAYRAGPHRTVLDRSGREPLMEASGFWRFAVLSSRGTVNGRDPLADLCAQPSAPAATTVAPSAAAAPSAW